MTAKLDITVLAGVSSGDVFHFHPEENAGVTMGRAAECDIVLQDPLVSRRHARIEHRHEGFFIIDEGSSHGTVHMGFTLKHGPEGARPLSDGDEFKIGDLLFRINFSEEIFLSRRKSNELRSVDGLDAGKKARGKLTPKRKMLAILAIVACAGLLIVSGGGKKGLPAQKSEQLITVPDFRVTGYWPGGSSSKKEEFDKAHADKAQFSIPSSDLLIEYDFRSEAKVDLYLDEGLIEHIEPSPLWQTRQMIVRGIPLGRERRIVFDNLAYPFPPEDRERKMLRWAVRDVRITPLSAQAGVDMPFDAQLRGCIGLVEGVDKSPEGLFLLVRGLQTAIVALLNEAKVDAVSFPISLDTDGSVDASKVGELQERLAIVERERQGVAAPDALARQTRELVTITAQLDAELWRRVNSRISKAQLSSKVKDYIEAHDQLISAQSMFPAEGDYRWAILQKLFKNEKVVPKRIRQNPEKFRK